MCQELFPRRQSEGLCGGDGKEAEQVRHLQRVRNNQTIGGQHGFHTNFGRSIDRGGYSTHGIYCVALKGTEERQDCTGEGHHAFASGAVD